jgi:hypothetical protein
VTVSVFEQRWNEEGGINVQSGKAAAGQKEKESAQRQQCHCGPRFASIPREVCWACPVHPQCLIDYWFS